MTTRYIERGNFTDVQIMIASLVNDMQANGFKVLNINNQPNTTHPVQLDSTVKRLLLAPTTVVDPLAIEDGDNTAPNYAKRQPWRLVIEVNSQGEGSIPIGNDFMATAARGVINWYVCTPTNIIDAEGNFKVAVSRDEQKGTSRIQARCGLLTTNSVFQAPTSVDAKSWIHKSIVAGTEGQQWGDTLKDRSSFRYEHFGFNLNRSDENRVHEQAVPLTYALSITDHGVAFMMWTEARDNTGDRFHWWTVQRMVNKDTGATILDGKSPLFCVFSMVGGGTVAGNQGDNLGFDDLLDARDDIYYFIVRESDVHTPTVPVTACFDTNDSTRIINVMQQVSISEENKLTLNMIKGMNTQRYSYPHELDMIAYLSGDVVSQFAEVQVQVYGEEQPAGTPHKRVYKALKANRMNNKGMRLLFIKSGGDINNN
jgi:hypothetical protein